MTVVVGTTEKELDKRIGRLLADAYQKAIRHVWYQDTTEEGLVHYLAVRPMGETNTLATHGRLSRFWHPRVTRAMRRAGGEILGQHDMLALLRATTPAPEVTVALEQVSEGVAVILVAR